MTRRRVLQRVVGITGVVAGLIAAECRPRPVERPVVLRTRPATPARRAPLAAVPSVRPLRSNPEVPARQRDVFAFRHLPEPEVVGAQPVAQMTASVESMPLLPTLIGIAEERRNGEVVRTAIVKVAGDVLFLTVGQAIGGLWTVTAIDAASVELGSLSTDATQRLVLR